MSIPIPAATLILVRDAAGAPEILMVERAAVMAFAAGAVVFPGGRVDPGDHVLAGAASAIDEAAARVAAIRETLEETGIAVAIEPAPDAATASALRAGLAEGQQFGVLLAAAGLRLDLAALVPFARWLPNLHQTRIFDTLFYVARAPDGAEPTPDGGENVAACWTSARNALDNSPVIFPTRRNLERLAQFGSFADIVADAARHPVETILPWTEERGGEPWLCIPEGRGYPVTAERLGAARRG